MAGYRNSDQSNAPQTPVGGKQRLKAPGSSGTNTDNEKPAKPMHNRISSFLSDHWGKVALGTAASVLVGAPLLASHVQMNREHPEFSALSLQGVAQRVHRAGDHIAAMTIAARYRSEASFKNLSDSFSLSRAAGLPDYAVICYDRELLARAEAGHPHARAYLQAARIKLDAQVLRMASRDAPFYKQHVSWDPDEPVPAAAFILDYDKFWYPKSDIKLRAPRPVSQWIAENGGGCPDGTSAAIKKLPFKQSP